MRKILKKLIFPFAMGALLISCNEPEVESRNETNSKKLESQKSNVASNEVSVKRAKEMYESLRSIEKKNARKKIG
jgi:uncharacterized lipoprotein YajG